MVSTSLYWTASRSRRPTKVPAITYFCVAVAAAAESIKERASDPEQDRFFETAFPSGRSSCASFHESRFPLHARSNGVVMLKKWILLTSILSLCSRGTLQANPLDLPDIVYIEGQPCNSARQSYMAWSATGIVGPAPRATRDQRRGAG